MKKGRIILVEALVLIALILTLARKTGRRMDNA